MLDLSFDIETIPDQKPGALDKHLASVKPPANYKKPETIDKWMAENAEAVAVENWRKTALDALYGEIVSIAWAFNEKETEGVIRAHDEPESNVIESFFAAIRRETHMSEGEFPKIQWIGHNLIDFDLRFLWKRCVILGIRPPVRLPINSRHGAGRVFDTMKEWEGFRGYVKQDAIAEALGFTSDNDMDGSQVWDKVQAGLLNEVLAYNCLDVDKVRTIYRRMTWEE